jgi:UDP-glucuronate decarboxylase
MRILVTGAAGFLGTHLCRALTKDGNVVIGIDIEPGEFVNIRQDVRENVWCGWNDKIDRIYNLACPASPFHYLKKQIFTIETSIIGAKNCADLACKKGARLLQASTSEIYGDPTQTPQDEDYRGNVDTRSPRSCYDEGKRAAETLLLSYKRERGLNLRIARIFNTYGPGMKVKDGRVVSTMINSAIDGAPIVVHRPGTQTRSFCYVDDTIRGLIALMESDHYLAEFPINIGNPRQEITMMGLAKKINVMCGREKHNVVFSEGYPTDPMRRRPAIQKAAVAIGWTPKIPLSEGLRMTIEDYVGQRNKDIQSAIVLLR